MNAFFVKIKIIEEVAKKHFLVFLVAIVIGIIAVLPHFLLIFNSGQSYKGIDIPTGDAELHYVTRIQDIYDGHYGLGNAFISDFKQEPYLQPPLPEIMIAEIGKLFFLSASGANLLAKFFFPATLVIILYLLIFNITKNILAAILGSLLVVFGINLMVFIPAGRSGFSMFFAFSRPINPPTSSIFLFGFLLNWWKFASNKKLTYAIVSGIILGVSFYVYFFTWSFLLVFLVLQALLFLIKKDWLAIKNLIILLGIASIIAIPYFINLNASTHSLFYKEASLRMGLISGHQLIAGGKLIILTTILYLFFFIKKRKDTPFYFLLSLLATGFFVLNQQIITGKILQQNHYHLNIIIPISFLVLTIILTALLEKLSFVSRQSFITAGVIGLLLFGFFIQIGAYKKNENNAKLSQRYGILLEWINKNIRNDKIILTADDYTSLVVTAYTHFDVYYNPYASYYLIPINRIKDALFLDYKLNDIDPQTMKNMIFKEKRGETASYLRGIYYRDKFGSYDAIEDDVLLELYNEYQSFYKNDLADDFRKNKIDYFICDEEKNKCNYSKMMFLNKVFSQNKFFVYQVIK